MEGFGDRVSISGQSTGLHLIARFPGIIFDEKLLKLFQSGGVTVYPVEEHAITNGFYMDRIILGYSHLEPDIISEGVRRMERVLTQSFLADKQSES